jgi:ribosome assembly protein YihI (activator of Der GTPase)
MNIDDRLQALTQNVELMAAMQKHAIETQERFDERQKRFDERQERLGERLDALTMHLEVMAGMQQHTDEKLGTLTDKVGALAESLGLLSTLHKSTEEMVKVMGRLVLDHESLLHKFEGDDKPKTQ